MNPTYPPRTHLSQRVYFCTMQFHGLLFLVLAGLCLSCANIQGISGGPEDLQPPKRIAELSSPDQQIRFNARELFIRFDEWVRLDNPNTRISISPATTYPLEFKLKGKTLVIRFNEKEVLNPNTTYTLQFGDAIRDITKGNILLNLKYAFSTGEYIDSLTLQGTVIDAFSQKAQGKVLVGLYRNLNDTAFERSKPFYLSWTTESGSFTLENLSPGSYKLYALADKNQNYFYDQNTEAIAFQTEVIELSGKQHTPATLQLSVQDFQLNIKEQRTAPGFAKISYTRIPRVMHIEKPTTDSVQYALLQDSLLAWNASRNTQILIVRAEERNDSLQLSPFRDSLQSQPLKLKITNVRLLPGTMPSFMSNVPIKGLDLSRIKISDSLHSITGWQLDSLDPRLCFLKGNFAAGSQMIISLDSGAVTSYFAVQHTRDTMRYSFSEPKSLSSLNIETNSLDTGVQYIFQLITNDRVAEERVVHKTDSLSWYSFGYVLPGTYKLRIISDLNKNLRWDPSDFKNKIQAEPVRYYDIPELRADWDLRLNLKN